MIARSGPAFHAGHQPHRRKGDATEAARHLRAARVARHVAFRRRGRSSAAASRRRCARDRRVRCRADRLDQPAGVIAATRASSVRPGQRGLARRRSGSLLISARSGAGRGDHRLPVKQGWLGRERVAARPARRNTRRMRSGCRRTKRSSTCRAATSGDWREHRADDGTISIEGRCAGGCNRGRREAPVARGTAGPARRARSRTATAGPRQCRRRARKRLCRW